MKINSIVRWAIKQSLGSARGAMVIALLEGPIGALLDTVALRGRGTIELERIEKQAQRVIDDINEVIR